MPECVPHGDPGPAGALVRPQLFRSHVYDMIVDAFVREFGAGGVCRDPLGFLMRLSVERDGDPALFAAQMSDLRCAGDLGRCAAA